MIYVSWLHQNSHCLLSIHTLLSPSVALICLQKANQVGSSRSPLPLGILINNASVMPWRYVYIYIYILIAALFKPAACSPSRDQRILNKISLGVLLISATILSRWSVSFLAHRSASLSSGLPPSYWISMFRSFTALHLSLNHLSPFEALSRSTRDAAICTSYRYWERHGQIVSRSPLDCLHLQDDFRWNVTTLSLIPAFFPMNYISCLLTSLVKMSINNAPREALFPCPSSPSNLGLKSPTKARGKSRADVSVRVDCYSFDHRFYLLRPYGLCIRCKDIRKILFFFSRTSMCSTVAFVTTDTAPILWGSDLLLAVCVHTTFSEIISVSRWATAACLLRIEFSLLCSLQVWLLSIALLEWFWVAKVSGGAHRHSLCNEEHWRNIFCQGDPINHNFDREAIRTCF